MAVKRYNAAEVHKLIIEDSSDSDNESEFEHDSDDSYLGEENGNTSDSPDANDVSSYSSNEDDDSIDVDEQGLATARRARGARGRGNRGKGQKGGQCKGRGRAADVGGQPAESGGTAALVGMPAGNTDNEPKTLTSKNGTITWMKQPVLPVTGRHAASNVMHIKPGPTRFATRNVDSPMSAFQLFMRGPILDEIEKWTNTEGRNIFADSWKNLARDELHCYLGVLILIGVYRAKNEPVSELWNKERGRSVISKACQEIVSNKYLVHSALMMHPIADRDAQLTSLLL